MSLMMLIDYLVLNHRQHAVEMSGKHWAGRVVAAVQILSWCAVSGLLLNKGLTNITNAAKVAEQGREPRGMTSGVVMVATGSFMLLVSPTILLIKFIDARRRRKRMQDSEEDLPPSYEQAMESAPRYSTLFLNAGSEIHEQLLECQNTDNQPAIIPMNSDSRELNSTAHLTHAPQNYVQKLLVPETEKLDGANVT